MSGVLNFFVTTGVLSFFITTGARCGTTRNLWAGGYFTLVLLQTTLFLLTLRLTFFCDFLIKEKLVTNSVMSILEYLDEVFLVASIQVMNKICSSKW